VDIANAFGRCIRKWHTSNVDAIILMFLLLFGAASLGDARTLKRITRGSSTITSDSIFVPFVLFLTVDSGVIKMCRLYYLAFYETE
jgi:hypothetical protein